jgi:beta-glucosidase
MVPALPPPESISLAQQIAQMIVIRASGYWFDHQIRYPQWEPPNATIQRWLGELGVGGVILLGGSAAEVAVRSHQLQSWASIPLLLAADIEEGVGQRFSGATWFPPPMALEAIAQNNLATAQQYAEEMGAVIAQEALAIGLNWVLAPVVDVNNNPQNPVINVRAFGSHSETVQALTTAFIRGAQRYPVLTTAKHFPGHGDTTTDSHLELPMIPHDLERLQMVELAPFQTAIAVGVDTVMTAHLRVPAIDPYYPATLSGAMLTQLLRQQMGFAGLIVTDALIMGAIADHYEANEAAVLAVEAGADIVLMPADPEGAIQTLCQAVEIGRITPARIASSMQRIWQAKQRLGLPMVSDCALPHQLSQPNALELVDRMLQASQHGYCPEPLPTVETGHNVILLDNVLDCKFLGRHTPAITLPARFGYTDYLVASNTPNLPTAIADRAPTILQLFIRGSAFRASAGLSATAEQWLQHLLTSDQLAALVIYGSPYILEQFLPTLPPQMPYVFSYGQTEAAQAIALSRLFSR